MTTAARRCEVLGIATIALVVMLLLHLPQPTLPWRARLVTAAPARQRLAALTFDDGPHPKFTPEVLQVLARHHVKATFFMIGERMAAYPDLVREVKARGNVIGNHTFTHPRDISACSVRDIEEEIDRCSREIEKLTGERPQLFRAPLGRIDAVTLAIAEGRGYRAVQWTVCADHHDAPTPEAMAARVFARLEPGMIILVHDGTTPGRAKDVRATELIVQGLQRRGYRLVTVPELFALSGYPLEPRSSLLQPGAAGAEAIM